jgi:membrane protein DedA with SNARE-associated domain
MEYQTSPADSMATLQAQIAAGDKLLELGLLAILVLTGIILGWLIGYFQGVKQGRKDERAAAKYYGSRG